MPVVTSALKCFIVFLTNGAYEDDACDTLGSDGNDACADAAAVGLGCCFFVCLLWFNTCHEVMNDTSPQESHVFSLLCLVVVWA